ncbi:MAG TPA: hypothetical protein VFR97_04990 [Capillimicrobium sp.]|nr:hypothetical protein [Capillimicrobium sp.]
MAEKKTSSPSPSPSPDDAAASSAASSTGSTDGLASALGLDAGPAFDGGDDAGPLALEEPPAPEIRWQLSTVKGLLTAQGMATHSLIAVDKDSEEWIHTQADLNAIAPPLTNILNRYDVTRAASAAGDELALIMGLAGYATRSIRERQQALAALREEEDGPQPITGIQPDHPQEQPWTTEQ